MKLHLWITLLLASVFATPALACRCSQRPLETYFQQADWVGRVKVEKMHDAEELDGGQVRPVAFQVLATHKGGGPLARVFTSDSHAACGMVLVPGREYWLFAHNRNIGSDIWWIDSCSGTRPVGAGFADVETEGVAAALARIAAQNPAADDAEHNLRQRTRLTEIDGAAVTEQMFEQFARQALLSPNGAWRLITLAPPAEARPPRVMRVIVERERDTLVELAITGANRLERIEWVNEKLVLARVVWTPEQTVDLLLDVQYGRIVYDNVGPEH